MAVITFYEKTGCINNTKQKKILELAGHEVESIHIVQYDWKKLELLEFFEGLPVADWFNKNAPTIQSGEISPNNYSAKEAIELILKDHLLIRRPLMIVNGEKIVGFDKAMLDKKIGLNPNSSTELYSLLGENVNDCPQKLKNTSCD